MRRGLGRYLGTARDPDQPSTRVEPSVAARLGRLADRFPWLLDTALAAATAAVSIGIGIEESTGQWRDFDVYGWTLTCLASLTLVARRRAPVTVLLVFSAIWGIYIAAGYHPVANSSGSLLALYTVAATRPAGPTAAAALVPAAVWTYAGAIGKHESMLATLTQSVLWPMVVCYVGSAARRLSERGHQLAVLTGELRRDRQELARRAVLDERLRIARDLHDVVAHHMSVVSVQAGLAWYVLESDPPTARSALRTVLDTTGEALDEMRGMLTVLRPDRAGQAEADPAGPSAPGLARLDDLIERMRAVGVPVEAVVTGERRPLPPGPDLCAYRFVQEALTNVLNHSGGAATVTLSYERDRFVARVLDDGPSPDAGLRPRGPAVTGGGRGLAGIRERARRCGGTLAVDRSATGFAVTLILPVPTTHESTAPLDIS
ncbi:sensor histidine kinase [Micromonospora rubida]|uniref:histidine kinase n=1 Tax=Micromonospora rubida TaxID=2697657 RepID=A0ABW7SCZ7_9ACTN